MVKRKHSPYPKRDRKRRKLGRKEFFHHTCTYLIKRGGTRVSI
jgi:hypothetical protein